MKCILSNKNTSVHIAITSNPAVKETSATNNNTSETNSHPINNSKKIRLPKIEPGLKTWEALVIPLDHNCDRKMKSYITPKHYVNLLL